jgi:hypothetical protein
LPFAILPNAVGILARRLTGAPAFAGGAIAILLLGAITVLLRAVLISFVLLFLIILLFSIILLLLIVLVFSWRRLVAFVFLVVLAGQGKRRNADK